MTRRRTTISIIAAAIGVIAIYLLTYPLHGYRVAIGSDTPVYEWWARHAGAAGLGDLGTGARAGIVGPIAVLSTVTGVVEAEVVAALGPVLAAIVALAAGALVEVVWGRSAGRFALTVVLTGMYLSLMAPGYFSTLAFGAAFMAGMVMLVVAIDDETTWISIVAASLLFGVAGLSHTLFLALGAVVVGGGAVALVAPSRRALRDGVRWTRTPLPRVGAAIVGGLAVVAGGLGLMGSLVGLTGSDAVAVTARDTLLRRLGFHGFLEDSYRRKLIHDFPWYRALTVLGAVTAPFASRRARRTLLRETRDDIEEPRSGRAVDGPTRSRFFWGAIGAWLVVTAVGMLGLAMGFGTPGQRLAAFCLPLPILAAVGLWSALGEEPRPGRAVRATVIAGITAVYVVVGWMAWNQQRPLATPAAVEQARATGEALGAQTEGTPLVVVVDNRGDKPSLFVVRALNYVRAAVPAARIPDVHVFVGSAGDFVAGRPTLTGQHEHDAIARSFWRGVRPLLRDRPLVVSLQGFDPNGFRAAGSLAGATRVAPGVVTLPGFGGDPCAPECAPRASSLTEPGGGPFGPPAPVWIGVLVLLVLGLIGLPWAWSVLPRPGGPAVAVAPAFG
ncbi:MAG: hypothetical protein ABR518_09750, partial [Actinomycetota bacterium]